MAPKHGCAQSGIMGGFCDSCCTYCMQYTGEGGEGVVEEAGKKRHQSVQSQRVRTEQVGGELGIVQSLIRDDSHVMSGGEDSFLTNPSLDSVR